MIKKISFFLTLFISFSFFGQTINLEKYQYIVVADKFDFLKKADEYQTSSLTKFLLKKKGFNVFLSNETLPKEIINNRCLSLFADIKDDSGMFSTKTAIEIKDCFGKVLYTSQFGKSKSKEYKKGYQEAIRKAYESMEDFQYSYNSSLIDKIKEKEVIFANEKMNPVKATSVAAVPIINKEVEKKANVTLNADTILFAQPMKNGFQLVNMKPEVVFLILKTKVKDVFVIKDKNGILYKNGGNWVAEFYKNGELVQKEYQVKF